MQARRASRELALILFSQFDKKIVEYSDKDFEDIILKSIRVLTNNSTDELKTAVGSLIDIKDFIETYEADDPSNLERPIGVKNKPVQIPTTADMIEKIDTILDVVEKTVFALEIAEFAALESQSDVQDYVVKIAKAFKAHYAEIDEQIQKFSKGASHEKADPPSADPFPAAGRLRLCGSARAERASAHKDGKRAGKPLPFARGGDTGPGI